MGIIFNAEEIFDIAVQIEKNGNVFYTKAAQKVDDAELKKQFAMLAEMEMEHVHTFSALRDELKAAGTDDYAGSEEAQAYLKAYARGHVFSLQADVEKLIGGLNTGEEILHTAIGAERDSIAFYSGMKNMVPDEAGKQKIDHIISEEMGHVALLSGILEDLKK
ncbi:MAG: ferritin family protein [Spirochaetales bacterium]|nr:ferritin family protein [Spirochaetales bacterium]